MEFGEMECRRERDWTHLRSVLLLLGFLAHLLETYTRTGKDYCFDIYTSYKCVEKTHADIPVF